MPVGEMSVLILPDAISDMAGYTGPLSLVDALTPGDVMNESTAVILLDDVPVCATHNGIDATD